jgi:hypothetical protein
MHRAGFAVLAAFCLAVPGAAQEKKGDKKKDPAVSFTRQVMPILKDRCRNCHYPADKKGGLDVTSYAAVIKGGKTRDHVVPGFPEKSLLVKEISGQDPPMPKNALPLTPEQIRFIADWIQQGARNN